MGSIQHSYSGQDIHTDGDDMVTREEIRGYFAGKYCSFISQEYCSSCQYTRKHPPQLCPGSYEYADEVMDYLDSQNVVIKVDGELPLLVDTWEQSSLEDKIKGAGYTATESLIEGIE